MEWNAKAKQRQYTLGVKHIGGNDREIDVDLLYGSKSSESLSDLVHDTESESDFSFEASDGIGKRVINTTTSNVAAYYQGTCDVPTTKTESKDPLLIKQNRYLHYLNEEFVNGAGRRDNVEDEDDINEMERCMSHFDKVLEEQSTHPINETKLSYQQRIEDRITGQIDRDGSLSKGIKKDRGRSIMQRHDLDEDKSFRETYGAGEESYHEIENKWDDLDIKQARIKYEQENDASILMPTNMVSKVRCQMRGVFCDPRRNSCDICNRHNRSGRSCDQSEGSCDHHNRGNYEAGTGRRGDESSIGLEQTRLVQLQLQKGTQLIKQQQERTFCLQQKKNCANNKHEAALPAGGLVVNATLPTLSHKSMTDPLCGSPLNSLPTESEPYAEGGGYSIHNDINSARLVQPISLEAEQGMDSYLTKERHLAHVDVASEWNEDTCAQSTLTQEEEKVGSFNGHKGVIQDSALDKEDIVCQGVKMDDNKMQLPLMKKKDKLKKGEKPLQSDAAKMQVVRIDEDIASKDLALKPGTVTDTGLDAVNCSMANIDDCSIGSQDSCKDISSNNLESAFDSFRKCDMIETIDGSTNSIAADAYIDSPGTIPLDCIREDSAFHGGNSAGVKSGDSAEYSLGNTICDSNTSAMKAIPQNDGEGVCLHQCNMPNEIQLEQEHKGHECGRQFESLQSSKLKNQYAGITVDFRGNEKSTDLVQSTQDSQLYYEWHGAKQPHSDSVESLNQKKGYQIAGLKEELEYEKGSQIVISKQDSLKCEGSRHSNLEGNSCVQGNESSLGDIYIDMKNEKSDLLGTSGSEPFENKTKLESQCTSSQVITHSSDGSVCTGNQDFQCQRQVPKENMEIYSPLRETDEYDIVASDKSEMLYTGTMGVQDIRQGDFCSDGDTKTRNEAIIRNDIACATGEFNRNQGHKGIHAALHNPGDNKCQSVQNNNASKENMSCEHRPLDNAASCANPHGNDVVLRRKDAFLNYHSKTMKAGVKLRSGAKGRRDPKLRYSASDIETLKKRYTMEPICMVADCTKCTKMTLENALLEDDYARLRNLQASHAEHQTDKSQKPVKEDVTVKAKDGIDDDVDVVTKETRGYIGTVKLRDRKPRGQPTGSQCVANRNLSRNVSTSRGHYGDDCYNDDLTYRTSSMRPNSNILSMRNANKVVSSSSDEEGIICGCMANTSSRQRAHRAQSTYEPYIRDVNNANRYVSDSDSDNSVASCRCRRTRSLYGMRPRKLDGAEEGLFSDVIDSYLAKSQSLSGGLDPRKNRYGLGDMPWLNEDEMKDGFLRPRAQRNDNSGYWRDNNSAGYNSGRLHGNIIDNSFFQRMRENLHQFDRNNRRNKRNEKECGEEALMEIVQKDSNSGRGKEEILCHQNMQAHSQEGDSNCQFSQNDRNHLHQSCDLIAQKIGESEQKSRSMFEIAESHRERQQCNEDYYSDASDESRLSLSYYVDMEKSVIIQSDITEHYRTDKIQYLESSSVNSLEETTSSTTTMTTANDTPATYKYNANTQKDLNPTKISNKKHLQQYNTRFKTETKTTLLDKTDRSNQNAMKTSTSGEICNKKIIEKEVDENEPKSKVSANVPQPKKSDEPAIIKPRQRLEVDLRKMKLTNENLMLRSIQEIDALIQLFYGQIQDVSEDLVVLLQERHELREQVDMRRIAVEQLVRLQNTDMLPITDLIDLDSCKISALPSPTKSERGSPKKSPASSS